MRQKLLVFKQIWVKEVKFFLGTGRLEEGIVFAFHFVTDHVIKLSFEPTCIDSLFSSKLNTEIGHKTFFSNLEQILDEICSRDCDIFIEAFVEGSNFSIKVLFPLG
jgi:hypothetical protein